MAFIDKFREPISLLDYAQFKDIRTEPLDIEHLVQILGIELRYDEFEDLLSGYLRKEGSKWVISVNEKYSEGQKRFIIAHELGHYILHKCRRKGFFDEATIFFPYHVSDEIEKEANLWAAELLMPEKSFRIKVQSGMTKIEDLAEYFKVSALSVKTRAEQLGY